ncbi:phosphate ABC transporter substrate-binding/OmpA family protein [Psychromonas sp. MME2]|uniref:phosphate ABC transporter substrate-binding/OmpA family protein n=1 Tax=unclassified Psychromonas TaxID=2614957 RepID=UPI00339C6EED
MSEQTEELALNPLFKEQLGLLQSATKSAYNIQLSVDKMIHDPNYRQTVLDELSELNNATLNQYIHVLQRTPVYIKKAKKAFSLHELPSLSPVMPAKNKPSKKPLSSENIDEKPFNIKVLIAISLLFLITFIAWQQGYLHISLKQQNGLHRQSELPLNHSYSSALTTVQGAHLIADQLTSAAISHVNEPQPQPEKLTLPSEERTISLRLHGSNTIGENLAPALLEAYLKNKGVKEMHWVQGEAQVERELQYIEDNKIKAIQLHAHGSTTGFKDLFQRQADIAMSSRKIKEKERVALRPNNGDLGLASQEYIIGLDGLAIIVNPTNPITGLTNDKLAKIFSGEITNWSELGGADSPINLYARDENSGTWDTFKNLVLKPNQQKLADNARRYESSNELSEQVAGDTSAIGFIGLPYVNNSKSLAIAESQGSISIYPTHFTISTEDYPLARRLYLYLPVNGSDLAKGFADFAASHDGQIIVENEGLISQNIKLESVYPIKSAPDVYNNYTDIAKRLSVNFRFQTSSDELDNKSKRDLPRLVQYMENNPGRRIALMGFSDALGDSAKNIKLSLARAKMIENELLARGISVVAVEGFGEQMPIASNSNALGRSKNRRVEVWFF